MTACDTQYVIGIWEISPDHFYKQVDGHSCGPIACLKVMDVFNCVECRMMEQEMSPKFYRGIVITKFEGLVQKLNNDLNVSVPCFKCELSETQDTELAVADDTESTSDNGVNCICYEHPKGMPTILLPCCAKVMHQPCLVRWTMSHPTCPYCRKDISMDVMLSTEAARDVAPQVPTKSIPRSVSRSPTTPEIGKCLPNTAPETPQTSAQKEARQKKQ